MTEACRQVRVGDTFKADGQFWLVQQIGPTDFRFTVIDAPGPDPVITLSGRPTFDLRLGLWVDSGAAA